MKSDKFTVTGTGDSLFVADFPRAYDMAIRPVSLLIQSCDLKLTNLETNLADFDTFGNAYSGGTWLCTRRKLLPELMRFGFNFFGTANNHAMDYSYAGLMSTIETLDARGLAHAGTGRSLEEAARPAIVKSGGCRSAVFAVDASMHDASRAGRATKKIPARPGVNFLRHRTLRRVDASDIEMLKGIAQKTLLNSYRDRMIATGYANPDPDGIYHFGGNDFTTDPDAPETSCDVRDKARLLDAVRAARAECDYVFILVHCHDDDGVRMENPPAYLIEFAHACVDAGVSAVFGGGCHRLRGIELYHGVPIFYSLGDFIYQGLRVEHLPADFMEKYDIDIFSTAAQALLARSRGNTVGLHCEKCNYQSVLPRLEFSGGKLTGFSMLPLDLNFSRKDHMNGLPTAAQGSEAAAICELVDSLSAPFGTRFKLDGGMIVPA